jgi:hypothetical protein
MRFWFCLWQWKWCSFIFATLLYIYKSFIKVLYTNIKKFNIFLNYCKKVCILDAHTTRHLTARHLTTRHFSTRHPDSSPLWQLATLKTHHSDNSPPDNSPLCQFATLTTRHHYNSPPWRICLDQLLYFDYFLLQCLCCTAPQIFHSIFCRFFVLINEIQHLLLHFNYVIFIYIKIVILYWWNVMVARCKGGEM